MITRFLILAIVAFQAVAQTPPSTTRVVQLTWTASATAGVTGYNVYRASSPTGAFTVLNTVPVSALSYLDAAAIGQTYTYEVTALAAACTATSTAPCGESAPSGPATTTIPPRPAVIVTVTVVVQ